MQIFIDHITIIVADLEKTREFYVSVLGMNEVKRPAFNFPGKWFEYDGFQIHATLSNEESGNAGPGNREVSVVSRGNHFAFRVNDFAASVEHMDRHGVQFVVGPKKRPDGISQVYIRDPDGYLIEICNQAMV